MGFGRTPSYIYSANFMFLITGLEEFENKVDKIAAGQEENSWISGLYKRLSENFGGTDDKMAPDQVKISFSKYLRKTFITKLLISDGWNGAPYSR
jgi:hypothetical protein